MTEPHYPLFDSVKSPEPKLPYSPVCLAAGASDERLVATTNSHEAPKRAKSDDVLTLWRVGLGSKPTSNWRFLNFEENDDASFGAIVNGSLMHHKFG